MATDSQPGRMREVLIGRQPIFDARMKVQAYELFFRFGQRAFSSRPEPTVATMQVLTDALTTFGLDRIVGPHVASINVTREFLLSDHQLPVAPERIMLELSTAAGSDQELLQSIDRWRARGFKVAIDHVRHDDAARVRLYERADLLKVDCLGRRPDELKIAVENLHKNKRPLLADKLESRREVDACLGMGFTFVQGYFLERPSVVKGRTIEASRASLLRLLVELQDPDCGIQRIEAIVRQDVGLAFRILRCVNSAAFSMSREVDSIREAVLRLGSPAVRNLVALLLLSSSSDQPRELLRMAMFRARTCELLTAELGWPEPARSFTVGLLSLFDALLGEPLNLLLVDLPSSQVLKAALLEHTGPSGQVLLAVKSLERDEWAPALALGLPVPRIQAAWMSAVEWVDTLEAQFAAQAS